MIVKFINPLIQSGLYQYDLLFIDGDSGDIINRVTTVFDNEPVEQDLSDRVNFYLTNWELDYTIESIEI